MKRINSMMSGWLTRIGAASLIAATVALFGAGEVSATQTMWDRVEATIRIDLTDNYKITVLDADFDVLNCPHSKDDYIYLRRIKDKTQGDFGVLPHYSPYNDEPITTVTLDEYYIGVFSVTDAQYRKVMDLSQGAKTPVHNITYDEIRGGDEPDVDLLKIANGAFMERLNYFVTANSANLPLYAEIQFDLPTEVQWEVATRAGTSGSFYDSDDLVDYIFDLDPFTTVYNRMDPLGWWSENNLSATLMEVGLKQPNRAGLYDTLGNAAQLMRCAFASNYVIEHDGNRPCVQKSSAVRAVRGSKYSESSYETLGLYTRHHHTPANFTATIGIGFRLSAMKPVVPATPTFVYHIVNTNSPSAGFFAYGLMSDGSTYPVGAGTSGTPGFYTNPDTAAGQVRNNAHPNKSTLWFGDGSTNPSGTLNTSIQIHLQRNTASSAETWDVVLKGKLNASIPFTSGNDHALHISRGSIVESQADIIQQNAAAGQSSHAFSINAGTGSSSDAGLVKITGGNIINYGAGQALSFDGNTDLDVSNATIWQGNAVNSIGTLNIGRTLNLTDTVVSNANGKVISFSAGRTLNVKSGSVLQGFGQGNHTIEMANVGTLNVENGGVVRAVSQNTHAVNYLAHGNGDVGTVVVDGGTVESLGGGTGSAINFPSGGGAGAHQIEVKSGLVRSAGSASTIVNRRGDLRISGGKVENTGTGPAVEIQTTAWNSSSYVALHISGNAVIEGTRGNAGDGLIQVRVSGSPGNAANAINISGTPTINNKAGAGSNAIHVGPSNNLNTTVTLAGNPSITGTLAVHPGKLEAVQGFAPQPNNTGKYTVYVENGKDQDIAVVNGKGHLTSFTSAHLPTLGFSELGNDIILGAAATQTDKYRIVEGTASGFKAEVEMSDGSWKLIGNDNVPDLNAILNAIKVDADGDPCKITFGANSVPLNIGNSVITLDGGGVGWDVELLGGISGTTSGGMNLSVIDIFNDAKVTFNLDIDVTFTGQGPSNAIRTSNNSAPINFTGGTVTVTGDGRGIFCLGNGGTVTVGGDTVITAGVNNPAILMQSPAPTLVLTGDPTINGTISVAPGQLSVADFNPDPLQEYTVNVLSGAAGNVAVKGGSGKGAFFTLLNADMTLFDNGTDLIMVAISIEVTVSLGYTGVPEHKAAYAYNTPYGSIITAPPVRLGYQFTGWVRTFDNKAINLATDRIDTSENHTLLAGWVWGSANKPEGLVVPDTSTPDPNDFFILYPDPGNPSGGQPAFPSTKYPGAGKNGGDVADVGPGMIIDHSDSDGTDGYPFVIPEVPGYPWTGDDESDADKKYDYVFDPDMPEVRVIDPSTGETVAIIDVPSGVITIVDPKTGAEWYLVPDTSPEAGDGDYFLVKRGKGVNFPSAKYTGKGGGDVADVGPGTVIDHSGSDGTDGYPFTVPEVPGYPWTGDDESDADKKYDYVFDPGVPEVRVIDPSTGETVAIIDVPSGSLFATDPKTGDKKYHIIPDTSPGAGKDDHFLIALDDVNVHVPSTKYGDGLVDVGIGTVILHSDDDKTGFPFTVQEIPGYPASDYDYVFDPSVPGLRIFDKNTEAEVNTFPIPSVVAEEWVKVTSIVVAETSGDVTLQWVPANLTRLTKVTRYTVYVSFDLANPLGWVPYTENVQGITVTRATPSSNVVISKTATGLPAAAFFKVKAEGVE